MIKIFLIGFLIWIIQGCSNENLYPKGKNCLIPTLIKKGYKQEYTKAKDWKKVYYLDGGIYALKKNNTLWEFSKIREEPQGILPITPNMKRIESYMLDPKEVNLFTEKGRVKKISVGYNRLYVITNSGILLALGREIRKKSYFNYLTFIDPIGEFKYWQSVATTGSSENGECTEHTLGFTKDGMLYAISDKSNEYFEYIKGDFPKPLGRSWKQVLMGCYTDYAMKKDGTFWKWGVDYTYPVKVNDKKLIQKITTKMKEIKEPLVSYNIDMNIDDQIKSHRGVLSDGSLWLLPKVEYK